MLQGVFSIGREAKWISMCATMFSKKVSRYDRLCSEWHVS